MPDIKEIEIEDTIYSIKDEVARESKLDKLVSGVNLKTINLESLLGEGDITIKDIAAAAADAYLSDSSKNPVLNLVIKKALDAKLDIIPDLEEIRANSKAKPEIPECPDFPEINIPNWAMQDEKPTYTPEEIGAIDKDELFFGASKIKAEYLPAIVVENLTGSSRGLPDKSIIYNPGTLQFQRIDKFENSTLLTAIGVPSKDLLYYNKKDSGFYLWDNGSFTPIAIGLSGSNITVDDDLSTTSTNPILNKVVTLLLSTKQDIISDLQSIREGAELGRTALQHIEIPEKLTNDEGRIDYSVLPRTILDGIKHVHTSNITSALLGKTLYCTDGKIRSYYRADNTMTYQEYNPSTYALYFDLSAGFLYRWNGALMVKLLSTSGEASSIEINPQILEGNPNPVSSAAIYQAMSELYTKPEGGIPESDLSEAVLSILALALNSVQRGEPLGTSGLPSSIVFVTLSYWSVRANSGTIFNTPNTIYILAHDFSTQPQPSKSQVFGANCILGALPGCKVGRCTKYFNDTYIAVGPQQIFTVKKYLDNPGSPGVTSGTYENASTFTELNNNISNDRILPEWWGAKATSPSSTINYHSKEAEDLGILNANAINAALKFSKGLEVYCGGVEYLIGMTIVDHNEKNFDNAARNYRPGKQYVSTNLHFAGSVRATDNFIGYNKLFGQTLLANLEIPAIIYVEGVNPLIKVEGSIVIPHAACDKTIVQASTVPSTYEPDKLYFVKSTSLGDNFYFYDVYTSKYSFETSQYVGRKAGRIIARAQDLTEYANGTFGGSNKKVPGMYGMHVSAWGGLIEVGAILKGDERAGFLNLTDDGKLGSYMYRRDVMHQGECTGIAFRNMLSSTIKIGFIEGFNDGVAFDGTHCRDFCFVQFNRFEFTNIGCNNAIHIKAGSAFQSLVNTNKDGKISSNVDGWSTSDYFDGCKWYFGGSFTFAAGNNGAVSSFIPTTSKSTFLLVEGNGGFSLHHMEFDNAPLRSYTALVDLSGAKDNTIVMHGNVSGDTGRIILWAKQPTDTTSSVYKYLFKLTTGYITNGETTPYYPIDTFIGFESLASDTPYSYSHLAALDKIELGTTVWNNAKYLSAKNYTLSPNNTTLYPEWGYPYGSTRSFINFRNGSCNNVIKGARAHMICYESVYSDGTGDGNEIHNCQSRYAIFEDVLAANGAPSGSTNTNGHWTRINAFHPVFDVVRFDVQYSPLDLGRDGTTGTSSTKAKNVRRVMVPDRNTQNTLKYVNSSSEITDYGLYVILSGKEEHPAGYNKKPYIPTRYPLYVKYYYYGAKVNGLPNNNEHIYPLKTDVVENVGWIILPSLVPVAQQSTSQQS